MARGSGQNKNATTPSRSRSAPTAPHALQPLLFETYGELPSGVAPMPVEMLWSAREYDRQPGGEDASRDEQSYAQLREDVRVNGIKDPVILDWDPETGKAYLSEGNHRVGIARELGLLDVPCRAVVGSRRSIERRPRTIQLTAAGMFDDDLPGYGGIYDPAALLVAQRVAA